MTEPFDAGSRLVAYLRDSSGAKQELSTAQPENVIRAWCAERGYQLVRLFVDAARPGGSTADRRRKQLLLRELVTRVTAERTGDKWTKSGGLAGRLAFDIAGLRGEISL